MSATGKLCRGCGATIPRDYEARTFCLDQLVFCNRRCFDQNAERLLKIFVPAMRHVAVTCNGKARDLIALALRSDTPIPLL